MWHFLLLGCLHCAKRMLQEALRHVVAFLLTAEPGLAYNQVYSHLSSAAVGELSRWTNGEPHHLLLCRCPLPLPLTSASPSALLSSFVFFPVHFGISKMKAWLLQSAPGQCEGWGSYSNNSTSQWARDGELLGGFSVPAWVAPASSFNFLFLSSWDFPLIEVTIGHLTSKQAFLECVFKVYVIFKDTLSDSNINKLDFFLLVFAFKNI